MKKLLIAIVLAVTTMTAQAASEDAGEVINTVTAVITAKVIQSFPDVHPKDSDIHGLYQAMYKMQVGAYNIGYDAAERGQPQKYVESRIYKMVEDQLAGTNVPNSVISFVEARTAEVAVMGWEEQKKGF